MGSIRTGELARLMGVNSDTVRRYVSKRQIPFHKAPSGHLYFTESDVKEILGEDIVKPDEKWVYYVRSSSGNKKSLLNQEEELNSKYPEPVKVIKDSASGLNENRKGIKKLFKLAKNNKITDIAITNKDRLTRFGYTYIQELLNNQNIKLHVLYDEENKTAEQELLQDFMSLIASFSGKFYKMRSKENQLKLLKTAENQVKTDN